MAETPCQELLMLMAILIIMIVTSFTVIFFIMLRVEVFSAVFLPITVLPLVTFARNQGQHTDKGKDTENELFHVEKFLT